MYSEDTLLRVELDLKAAQVGEGLLEILQKGVALLRPHHYIIHIDVGISAELLQEALLHATLNGGAGISQTERHGQVAEGSKRHDEGGLQSIGRVQLDLVIS